MTTIDQYHPHSIDNLSNIFHSLLSIVRNSRSIQKHRPGSNSRQVIRMVPRHPRIPRASTNLIRRLDNLDPLMTPMREPYSSMLVAVVSFPELLIGGTEQRIN